MNKTSKKKQKYPAGWDEARVRKLAEYYDNQTDEEAVAEIEAAISQLPLQQAEALSEWLEQWLEDQRKLSPEFVASIERGKADIAAGRTRVVRP